MFVTILTIIYSAIALFIMVRFAREKAPKLANWMNTKIFKPRQDMYLSSRDWKKADADEEQISKLRTEIKV